MVVKEETLAFQAETKELLGLMIHSLYTNKDLFLRELISNASDALDRLRFESLTNPGLLDGDNRFEIRLEVDQIARTLSIHDSGVGMSRDEVVANIGTIAWSGTKELRRKNEAEGAANMVEMIGQFGVGFYSAFMVADKVTLLTRRAGESAATEWESTGDGAYTIREAIKSDRGTTITLYLKQADPETGIEDYTDSWRLANIVKTYSDYISYPIICKQERYAEQPHAVAGHNKEIVVEDQTLNSMKPIWKRPPAEVSQEEHIEFYKRLSHDWTEPLKTILFKAEGTFEYQSLLYIPSRAASDLYYVAPDTGLRLVANRVVVMEKCQDLLPRYLRFVRGVVDTADLPLNISRQRLQQDQHINLIRKRLTRKLLDALQDMFDNEYEKYVAFWREFGRALKEAMASDFDNKEKVLSLLLFQTSNDPEKLTTLKDYLARMKPGQEQILYLTGESLDSIKDSPHLEAVREKGYEALYLTDTVDELMLQYLPEFEGKKLKSIGKGWLKLGTEQEIKEAEKELDEKQAEYGPLMKFLERKLEQHVKQVRLSSRLTASPACLVVEEHDYSPILERALHKGNGAGPKQRRVLELNPKHSLIVRMRERYVDGNQDLMLDDAAEVLFGLVALAEGSELPNPMRFNQAASKVLTQAV